MSVLRPQSTMWTRSVLVVEDDDDSREMLTEVVQMLGHRAAGVSNAHDAIEQMQRLHPDVAVIDMGLPDVEGCETARLLRACPGGADIRLVALTGYSDAETRSAAKQAGFDAFIVKPIVLETFASVLVA